jgi:hypothetical protein
MPIGRWRDFLDDGELKHFARNMKAGRVAKKAYETIHDQLIDQFGVSETFLDIMRLEARIEEMYSRQLRTGDRSNQLLIDVEEMELSKLKDAPQRGDFNSAIVYIEKEMGFPLDPEKTSLFTYYNYSRYLSKKSA